QAATSCCCGCAAGTVATPTTTSRWWGCSRGDSGQCCLGRGWIDPPRERIELRLETIDARPEVLHLDSSAPRAVAARRGHCGSRIPGFRAVAPRGPAAAPRDQGPP